MRIVLTALLVLLGLRQEVPRGSPEQAPSLEDLEAQATEAFDRGDWGAAALAQERLVAASPKGQKARIELGVVKMRLGDLEGAFLAFQQATEGSGDLGTIARQGLALVHARRGEPDAAHRELSRALEDASPDTRLLLVRATREDPECEALRSQPACSGLLESVLDPVVASPLRDKVHRFLQASGAAPSDVGLIRDGRVVLYLDRSDFRNPRAPFLFGGTHDAILEKERPSSLGAAEKHLRPSLPSLETAPELWAKARMYSQLLGHPVGVVEQSKLFVYFSEPERIAIIAPQIVSIVDLLLKQRAGSEVIPFEKVQLSDSGVVDALRNEARPAGEVRPQFDVVFGVDPLVQLVTLASRALHSKDLIRDPRGYVPPAGGAFHDPHYVNPCIRLCGNPRLGIVLLTWQVPQETTYTAAMAGKEDEIAFRVTADDLGTLETTARSILAQMQETEGVFIPLFDGLVVNRHARQVPTRSPEFWAFFEEKDWSWWKHPRLASLAQRGSIQPILKSAFKAQGHEANDQDFGGAWAAYFKTLNDGYRAQMTQAIERIVIADQIAITAPVEAPVMNDEKESRKAQFSETFVFQGHEVTMGYTSRRGSSNRQPAAGSNTVIAYEIEVRGPNEAEFRRIVNRKQVPYCVPTAPAVLQAAVLRMRNGDTAQVTAAGAVFPDLKRWNVTSSDKVRMSVELLAVDGFDPE